MNNGQHLILFRKHLAHMRLRGKRLFSTTFTRHSDGQTIAGTAPSLRCYVLLHSSVPPSVLPAKVMSPLQRALQMKLVRWGGFVNWAWYEHPSSAQAQTDPRHDTSGPQSATAFSSSGERIEIPHLSLSNVDEVQETLLRRIETSVERQFTEPPEEIHLLVCTHMERDCRCGEQGGELSRLLKQEVQRRSESDVAGVYGRIRIGEVSHVGQHQYAPNLLVYPRGDWLGLIKNQDIPTILDQVVESSTSPSEKIVYPKNHWRGRMGLSKDEQLRLYSSQ